MTQVRVLETRPKHSNGCSNWNVLDPEGQYEGVAECGCRRPLNPPPPQAFVCDCEARTGYIHEVYPGNGQPPYRPTKAQCERSKQLFGFDTVIAEVE